MFLLHSEGGTQLHFSFQAHLFVRRRAPRHFWFERARAQRNQRQEKPRQAVLALISGHQVVREQISVALRALNKLGSVKLNFYF